MAFTFGGGASPFGAKPTTTFGAQPAAGTFGALSLSAAVSQSPLTAAAPPRTGAFGAKPPAFGQPQTPARTAFGAPAFGAAAAATPFGAAAAKPPLFGAGATTTTTFGQAATTGGLFGGGGALGGGGAVGSGSGNPRYATQTERTTTNNKTETVTHTAITLMPQYAGKSFEQIRAEDYAKRSATGQFAMPTGAPAFGAGAATFGAGAAAAGGSLFGAKPAFGAGAATFGGATTAFGAAAAAKPFGQQPAAASTFAFGGAKPATAPFGQPAGAFGQPAATTAFGAAKPAFGGFGAAAAATPAFGQPAAAATGFQFGQTAAKPPAFGAPATPGFGGFGAAAAKPFGTTPAASTFQFGQPAATPAFGAGAATTGGGLFGGFGAKPATPATGFAFGGLGAQQQQQQLLQQQQQQQIQLVPPTHPLLQIKSPLPYGPEPQSTPNPYAESAAEAAAALNGLSKSSASERARMAVATSSQHYKLTPRVASRLLPRGYGTPQSASASEQRVGGADTGVRDLAAVSELLVPRHSVKKLVIEPGDDQNDAEEDAAAVAAISQRGRRAQHDSDDIFGAPPPFRNGLGDSFADTGAPLPRNKSASTLADDEADGFVLSKPADDTNRLDDDMRDDDDNDDDDKVAASVAPTPLKGVSAVAAAAAPNSAAPKLTRDGYYVRPSLRELGAMTDDELARVSPFAVGHVDLGCVEWIESVDCRRLDLDELVHFFPAAVEVYPEGTHKAPVGTGLNRPARVTLLGVLPLGSDGELLTDNESLSRFRRRIERSTAKLGARLLGYDERTGEWRFQVEHFSRYGLADDDDEDEPSAAPPPIDALPPRSALPPTQLAAWQRKHRRVQPANENWTDPVDHSQLHRGAVLPQQLGLDARSMQILRHGLFGSITETGVDDGALDANRLLGLPTTTRAAFGVAEAHKALRQMAVDAEPDKAPATQQQQEQEEAAPALVNIVPFLPVPSAVPASESSLAATPTCRAAGSMGRAARVGWGANGLFTVIRGNRVELARVAIPDAQPQATALALLGAHLRASDCLAVAGGDGGPMWRLADARAFVSDVMPVGGELWRLADALWSEDVPSNNVSNEATAERQRKRALDEWLARQCRAELKAQPATTGGDDAWLDDVFALLCQRRVGDATAACVRAGDLRLATLVGQIGAGPSADVRAQIELWTRQARFVHFSAGRQRVYRLLAGDVRAVCSTIADSLSWRVALALHSWYAHLERDSVAAALTVYEMSAEGGHCARPLPDWLVAKRRADSAKKSNDNDDDDDDDDNDMNDDDDEDEDDDVFDAAYLLVRLFVHRSTSLAVVCDPRTYCRKGVDYLPAWCLYWTLTTLGYPPLARIAELSSALARQLDTPATWQWAVYALLCTPASADDALARRARAIDLIGRHAAALVAGDAKQRSAQYAFLLDKLCVPAPWLETAIAWHARASGDVRLLPQALLLAGEWQELHESVLRDVAPAAILAASSAAPLASLRVLLDALRDHRDAVGGWAAGGAVLLDFLDCERDVSQWRRRFAVAAAGEHDDARAQQLQALLARVQNTAVHIAEVPLADAAEASSLTATTLGVDGAARAALAFAAQQRRVEADACRAELASRCTQLLLAVRAMLASASDSSDLLLAVCPTLLAMPLPEDFRLQTCARLLVAAQQ